MNQRATLEGIIEVGQLAANKLAGLELLLSPIEYQRALLASMRSIASDIQLDILEPLIEVESPEVIEAFERNAPSAISAHLLIQCGFEEIRPWIEKLCSEDRARSLIFRSTAQQDAEAGQIAAQFDNVPVFLARTSEEVASLIHGIELSPYDTLRLALNGDRVALRFLEGNPS